jgi:hypothetical protein
MTRAISIPLSAFSGRINSTGVNWQFSGTASVNLADVSPYAARGDMTTEIGRDGTVYIVSMASTSFLRDAPVDRIVILRSRNGGSTFEPAVSIPGLPVPVIDKPVVAVHPNDSQTLVITFQKSSGGTAGETWLAICNAAATGDLSSASNWSFIHPMRSSDPSDLLKGYDTVHPLIDPVSSTSPFYWLFIVNTNDDFGLGAAGFSVFKYQITNRSYSIDNGGAPVQTLIPPGGLGYPLWTNSNIACTSIEDALRVSESCARGRANLSRLAASRRRVEI